MNSSDVIRALTLEEIEECTDILEAMDLAEKHNVNQEKLEHIEEIKIRLRCHYWAKEKGNRKEKMLMSINTLGVKDRTRRDELEKMVIEVRNIFTESDVPSRKSTVEDLLLKDGTTDDIRHDCDVRIQSLKEKECVILVAGESSAGKSSLLNLILGEEILPSHMLPCTSCITVIRYGMARCASIIKKDKSMEKIQPLDKEGLEKLQNRAYFNKTSTNSADKIYQRRKEEHDIAEIQIFLPLTLLQSGLVFVDTPGVGESEFLQNYLMEYIHTHQILGFMYVIMTDNALGIAEDRLVNLMSLIIKSQKNSNDIVKFNPNAALFVCNRWDMVEKDNREAKRSSALKQLRKCWPEFDPSNVVFFSTYIAQREVNVNNSYITEDFIALLHGIHKLADLSMDKRIKASYGWLGNVLQRSVHYLRTMVRRLDMTDRDRQKRTHEVKQKLKILNTRANDVVKTLNEELSEAVTDICEKVREFLQTSQAKLKLTKGWGTKQGEIPDMEVSSGTWSWVKRHIQAAFEDRLTDLLDEWDTDQKLIAALEKKLSREAKLKLCFLESELAEIENENDDNSLSRTSSLANLGNLCNSIEDFEMNDLTELSVPNKIMHRISRFMTKGIRQRNDDSKLKHFQRHPTEVAKERSEKILKNMLKPNDDMLEIFVKEMLHRPANYIKKLESKLPNMVDSNMSLLEKFEKEIVDERKNQVLYESQMTKIEELRRNLIRYGECVFVPNDFKEDEIEIVHEQGEEKSFKKVLKKKSSVVDLIRQGSSQEDIQFSKLPFGLWHTVHKGKITKGSQTQYVMVKIYSKSALVQNINQEIAKLRCLLHQDVCIAEFIGMYQQRDTPIPALVYTGNLTSLQNFMQDRHPADIDGTKILLETLSALQYIHSKGLVHMELRKDTLTVNETGEVKVTGACLPRSIGGDISRRHDHLMSDSVYLAPEVLNGGIYITHADLYAFAILAIEVNMPFCVAFENERALNVRQFLEGNMQENLRCKIENTSFSVNFKKMIINCLSADVSKRINTATLATELKGVSRVFNVRRTLAPKHLWQNFSTKRKH